MAFIEKSRDRDAAGSASTPDIVCSYEQGSGYLYIYVDADYKAAALAGNITIDSIHVESEQ